MYECLSTIDLINPKFEARNSKQILMFKILNSKHNCLDHLNPGHSVLFRISRLGFRNFSYLNAEPMASDLAQRTRFSIMSKFGYVSQKYLTSQKVLVHHVIPAKAVIQ